MNSNEKSKLEANLMILEQHKKLIEAYIFANQKALETGTVPNESCLVSVNTLKFYS